MCGWNVYTHIFEAVRYIIMGFVLPRAYEEMDNGSGIWRRTFGILRG